MSADGTLSYKFFVSDPIPPNVPGQIPPSPTEDSLAGWFQP